MKRTTRQYITVALICITIIGGAAIITSFIITKQIRQEYEYQLSVMKQEKEENQRIVYEAVNEIKCGDRITEDNIIKKKVYSSQPQNVYMTEEGVGMAALLSIPAGTHIMVNALTENVVSSELREVEYDVIQINTNIITNDMVDVRIFYPNGEDFTILSKKSIKRQEFEEYGCFLWLTEEELLRMQSAVIDAYLYTGAYLYTTKYIEPNIQEASIVNYEPSIEAIKLIRENPNIIQTATNDLSITVRKALENRLTRSLHKDVTIKQWSLEDDYIYQQYEGSISDPEKASNNSVLDYGIKDNRNDQPAKVNNITKPREQKDHNPDIDKAIEFDSPELGKQTGDIPNHDIQEALKQDENGIHKINSDSNHEYGNDIFIVTEG